MIDTSTCLTKSNSSNNSTKLKRGDPGYICECRICLNHRELERIEALLPPEDAKKLRDMWENLEQENFDLNWDVCTIEERWKIKYDHLESKISNVLII